jgi:hypothetical protein
MKFIGQVFTSDVTLDYNEFVDCEFRGCTVLFHGGEFSLVRAQGPHLLQELLDAAPAPKADQSITIN